MLSAQLVDTMTALRSGLLLLVEVKTKSPVELSVMVQMKDAEFRRVQG
jgi:hypothetical protein